MSIDLSVVNNPGINLENFTLDSLAYFTRLKTINPHSSLDHRQYYTGTDNVHEILKYLWTRVSKFAYMNMYGYDDDELNAIVWEKIKDPTIKVFITLDLSQADGIHEKELLAKDCTDNLALFNTHIAIGESETHQISHTKGGVLDGIVGFDGSTNWSVSGEGVFLPGYQVAGGPGYKAQNNTFDVFTNPVTISNFTAVLNAEFVTMQKQMLLRNPSPVISPAPAIGKTK